MSVTSIALSAVAQKSAMQNQQMAMIALKQQQAQGGRIADMIAASSENLAKSADSSGSGINVVV